MTHLSDDQDVKVQIREAVQSGSDIQQKIKRITINALTKRQLDMEHIKNVTESVGNGISEGLSTQADNTKVLFSQAISALDDALATAAEASKLAIEEAASRVDEYSRHDLADALENVRNMEGSFLDTLERVAKDGNRIFVDIVRDFVAHARLSGTAVGHQALSALEPLTKLQQLSKETMITNTAATTATLAQIGSGILQGIAESLQPSHPKS